MNLIPNIKRNSHNLSAVRHNFLSLGNTRPELKNDSYIARNIGIDNCIEDNSVTAVCLNTASDIKKIAHLREHIDLSINHKIDLNFDAKEEKKDKIGLVIAFTLHNQIIGTIRYVPMQYNLTLTETLIQQESLDNYTSSYDCWEAGRLVLDPDYRSGQDLLKKCVLLSVECLIENSNVEVLLGSCTHTLSRLYNHFGFTPLAKNIRLQDTEKTYTIIQAPALRVREVLSKKKSH